MAPQKQFPGKPGSEAFVATFAVEKEGKARRPAIKKASKYRKTR